MLNDHDYNDSKMKGQSDKIVRSDILKRWKCEDERKTKHNSWKEWQYVSQECENKGEGIPFSSSKDRYPCMTILVHSGETAYCIFLISQWCMNMIASRDKWQAPKVEGTYKWSQCTRSDRNVQRLWNDLRELKRDLQFNLSYVI